MGSTDVTGMAFRDYLSGRRKGNFVVHSGIAEDEIVPVGYFFRGTGEMPAIERRALELCRGKVLDVGAAAGCHSLVLQNRGLDVYPVDISEGAVEVMKKRGLHRARRLDFFKMKHEKYDTLLLLMNGIGICGTLQRLNNFFGRARRLLSPGGQILMDSSDLVYMYDGHPPASHNGYYGEVEYRMQYGKITGAPFPWVFVDFGTLSATAKHHGFVCQKIMDGTHFDYLARLQTA